MSRVKLVDDRLYITADGASVPVGVHFRPVADTAPFLGRMIATSMPLSLLLDNRAPGTYHAVLGGPQTKAEFLADIMVHNDLVVEVADRLADFRFLKEVNERLTRAGSRLKRDVMVMDHETLYAAVLAVTGGTTADSDESGLLARILTALISIPYMELAVMVPFVGVVDYKYFSDPVANLDTIIHASKVADVTEVLEAIELGANFRGTKEFASAMTESLLSTSFVSASSRLMGSLLRARFVQDTAVLTGMWMVNHPDLPEHIRDHPDLPTLASNASFSIDGLKRIGSVITIRDFQMAEAIKHTMLRLRELRRFTPMPLKSFRDMYSHDLVKLPSGDICGAIAWRNEGVDLHPQVSRFVKRANYTTQTKVEVAETYLKPMTDMVNAAFSGRLLQHTVAAAAQHLISRTYENNALSAGGYVMTLNLTESEIDMLALAHCERIAVSDIIAGSSLGVSTPSSAADSSAFVGLLPRIIYDTGDIKACYKAAGVYSGQTVMTDDPMEVLMLTAADYRGPADFVRRPQTFMEDTRRMVIGGELDRASVRSLSKPIRMDLEPLRGAEILTINVSLAQLLGLGDLGELHLTLERAPAALAVASFSALLYIYDELRALGEPQAREQGELVPAGSPVRSFRIDTMMAKQVAVSAHALWGRIADSPVFSHLARSIFLQYIQQKTLASERHMLREQLADAAVQHQIALNIGAAMLLSTGMLRYGLHEDIANMFTEQDVALIAVTGENWQRVMRIR
jgi:hypothetical protein